MIFSKALVAGALVTLSAAHFTIPNDDQNMFGLVVNAIPAEKRIEYMRKVFNPAVW